MLKRLTSRVFKREYLPSTWTILSGVLFAITAPHWHFPHLGWIAFVPWLYALSHSRNLKHDLIESFWFGMIFNLSTYAWVGHVLEHFAGLPAPLALIGLLIYSSFSQPQFYAFAILQRLGVPSTLAPLPRSLLLALLYAGVDQILPKLFHDTLGHATYDYSDLRQIAEFGGAYSLTFLVFWVNTALAEAISKDRRKPALVATLIALTAVAGASTWGHSLRRQTLSTPTRGSVQMAGIQGNIGDFDKLAAEGGALHAAGKVFETYFRLSEQALATTPRPEILVWPETTYPSTYRTPQTSFEVAKIEQMKSFVRERNTPLLFGGYDSEKGRDFNSFFFLLPSGSLDWYHKTILLMFGETIPFADDIPWIRKTFPQVGQFGLGSGPRAIEIPLANNSLQSVKVGPLICYEALYPSFTRGLAQAGADLILNITNDSWFGEYGEPELHLVLSAFRSIETRLPQFRVTNSGVSALIHPDGTLEPRTGLSQEALLIAPVSLPRRGPSFITRYGDLFGWCALLLAIASILALRVRLHLSKH